MLSPGNPSRGASDAASILGAPTVMLESQSGAASLEQPRITHVDVGPRLCGGTPQVPLDISYRPFIPLPRLSYAPEGYSHHEPYREERPM